MRGMQRTDKEMIIVKVQANRQIEYPTIDISLDDIITYPSSSHLVTAQTKVDLLHVAFDNGLATRQRPL